MNGIVCYGHPGKQRYFIRGAFQSLFSKEVFGEAEGGIKWRSITAVPRMGLAGMTAEPRLKPYSIEVANA